MMRIIKMTRNITRFKITSDLQIKHELASNKKRAIYPHDNTWPSQDQNIPIYGFIWLYSNHMALNYTNLDK
jgi:hypothetical protein